MAVPPVRLKKFSQDDMLKKYLKKPNDSFTNIFQVLFLSTQDIDDTEN